MATLTSRIKLAEFSTIPEHEAQSRVDSLLRGSVSPSPELLVEQMQNLNDRIQAIEERQGMQSDVMRRALKNGAIQETMEVCQWLMLLELRESLD